LNFWKPENLVEIWQELFTHKIFNNRGAFWLSKLDYDIFKKNCSGFASTGVG
jgi:hypothetical protein